MRMTTPVASFRGRFTPHTEPRAFLTRVARRVEAGFLSGAPHFRSRYAIALHAGDELAIRSEGSWTDFNVGLNDIALRVAGDGAIEYRVTFTRWLRGSIVLCGALVAVLLLLYFLPLPAGLSIADQLRQGTPAAQTMNRVTFWGSLAWWGLAWPWVLAAFHRRFAEGLLLRILGEVDAAAGPSTGSGHVTRPPAAA
jgi:hypothetical protein